MDSYIKSPMNYTGGKYKILNDIIPSFPSGIKNFVDLFAGGLNVGINVNADTIYANDQISYIIDLYKLFQDTSTDDLVASIKARIEEYQLSQENQEGYLELRKKYNETGEPLDLFVLTCYAFNHQIRFNSKHQFNTPFGKERSSFNPNIESNLIRFCDALHKKNIILSTGDFLDFDFSLLSRGDLVYCDPPYQAVLEVNRNDISSELRKYVNNDIQLSAIIEYMGYDEGVLHEHEGNVFFVNESNWLIARLVNHMTGEIVQDDIILDSGSITDVLNSRDAFFDYIFGTENH